MTERRTPPEVYISMSSIKTDAEIENLLNHKNNSLLKKGVKVKILGKGNHGNGGNIKGTTADRNKDNHATVAVVAELIGNKGASELLDVHEASVSKYKNGKNSNNDVDVQLKEKIENKLEGISKKVVDKVDTLLEIFAQEKMASLDGKEIPPAIERLINTYDKVNRRHESGNVSRPQVLLWAPKQINIDQFVSKDVD